jgi:GNAT superfamily N-acetyltransferase
MQASPSEKIAIRIGEEGDIKALITLDPAAQTSEGRAQYIRKALNAGAIFVAIVDDQILGYAVFEYSFFERGFLAMLFVEPGRRRAGIGTALIRHMESACESERLFTSTNESNRPMQSLLERLGYAVSGRVGDLDPGDPEVFYSKNVRC